MTPTMLFYSFLSGAVGGVIGHFLFESLYAWYIQRKAWRFERYRRRQHRDSPYQWQPKRFDWME